MTFLGGPGWTSQGPHFDPDGAASHGGLRSQARHSGDLGNIRADEDGVAQFLIEAPTLKLFGNRSIVGRSLVVHADEDDLGLGKSLMCSVCLTAGHESAWLAEDDFA